MNPMREIRIQKITLNMGVGAPGEKLDRSVALLKQISGAKPVRTSSIKRIPTWGVRPKLQIACKVTLRGEKARVLLERLLQAVENFIPEQKIDNQGNFSFGIDEYINIPNVEYDQKLGIVGLEVAVTLERLGYRIKRRMYKKKKIPLKHRIVREETIKFLEMNFNVKTKEGEGEE